ncbi:beta-alanine-activating enzyme-like isoform X2 [Artemia franciscana]|uniref:beta-alanine-activating enzyme-like isoform X2 n=1 Tax=Artemia franciscana TaxID=6661 RepID=UPI0032D9F0A5
MFEDFINLKGAFSEEDNISIIYYDGITERKLSWNSVMSASFQVSQIFKENNLPNLVNVDPVKNNLELLTSLIYGINLSGRAWCSISNPSLNCATVYDYPITNKDLEMEILGIRLYITITANKSNCKSYENIAYVVSTSGTTGKSKIVHVTYNSILPNIKDLKSIYNVTGKDVIFLAAPLSFDPAAVDIYLSLYTKSTLIILPEIIKLNPSQLVQILFQKYGTSIIQCTPSLFLSFPETVLTSLVFFDKTTLRILALGGEAFPSFDFMRFGSIQEGRVSVFNLYGITEMSCWASIEKLCFESGQREVKRGKLHNEVSLGKGLSETSLRLRDNTGEEIFHGFGEIFIESANRLCYVDDEDVEEVPSSRATGDVGELINGKLYFRGRNDEIIKRFGRKVSITKLESLALETGLVQFAVGLIYGGKLYLLINENTEKKEFMRILLGKLDSYHVPDHVLQLRNFPRTAHGKLDMKALHKVIESQKNLVVPSSDELKSFLQTHWCLYSRNDIPPKMEDNFILVGGNSISCIQLATVAEEFIGQPCPEFLDILMNKSFEDILDYLALILKDISDSNKPAISTYQTNLLPSPRERQFLELFRSKNDCAIFDENYSDGSLVIMEEWSCNMNKCVDASPLLVKTHENYPVIFIGSHSKEFSAINGLTGEKLWTTNLGGRIESSAAISKCGKIIYIGCYDGNLYAISSINGSILWEFKTDGEIKSSPFVSNCGKSVFFGSHDKYLYSVCTKFGKLKWKVKYGNGSVFSSPAATCDGALLFSGSLDGTVSCINSEGEKWKKKLGNPIFSSPLPFDDVVVFGCVDGCIYGFDFAGNEVFKFFASGPIFSSFCLTTNSPRKILFGSHDFHLYCIKPEGSQVWKHRFNSPIYSTPFAFKLGSRELTAAVSTSGELRLLNANSGDCLATYSLSGEVFSSPVVWANKIFVGCRNNMVYCLSIKAKTKESCYIVWTSIELHYTRVCLVA